MLIIQEGMIVGETTLDKLSNKKIANAYLRISSTLRNRAA